MKKITYPVYALLGIVFLVSIWFWFLSNQNIEQGSEVVENETVTETMVQLEADVYPLYSGTKWGRGIVENDQVRIVSEPFTDITNIQAVSEPFTKYYHQKLTTAGWELDMMREASGPGANMSYYAKGEQFIIIGFESEFKVKNENAPSECPCDVTLSIVSGAE